MKGLFRTLIIVFICLGVIRVGLGATDELHLKTIITFLSDNQYGTTHVRDTIVHFSEIQTELKTYQDGLKDENGADLTEGMDFFEKISVYVDQIVIYGKFVVNGFVLLYRFVELLITELVYLMRIAAYLLFGVAM